MIGSSSLFVRGKMRDFEYAFMVYFYGIEDTINDGETYIHVAHF